MKSHRNIDLISCELKRAWKTSCANFFINNFLKYYRSKVSSTRSGLSAVPFPDQFGYTYSRPPQGQTVDHAFFPTLPSVLNPLHFLCVFSLLFDLPHCFLSLNYYQEIVSYNLYEFEFKLKNPRLACSHYLFGIFSGLYWIAFCGRYFKIL